MKPEEKARQKIDQLLEAGGWQVQAYQDLHLSASFSGQLVPQKPKDEPAEKLLARLKAAKIGEANGCRQRTALKRPGTMW